MIKKKIFIATAVFASICMLGGCATSKSSKKAAEATTEAAQQAKATPVKLNASEYVKLGQYKGLTIKGASTKVTDQDVENQVNELAHDNASYEEIKDRKTVQKDDYLNVDYTTTINGKENSDYSDSNLDMHLGDGNLNVDENVDVDEKLIGAKVGDTVTIEFTFPEDYGAADLAGKEATFKVTVHEIKEKHLPEIDDELAKDVNIDGVETLDQLKDHIKANIKTRKESENENKFMDDLYKAIVASSKVEDSDALLEQEQGLMLQEVEQNLQRQGLNFEVYQQFTGKSKDDIKEDIKPQAEERVKLNAILAAIIEEEKLAVSDEELETELKTIAEYYQKELDEVKKIFEGNMSRIENDLLTRKAVDLVKDNLK